MTHSPDPWKYNHAPKSSRATEFVLRSIIGAVVIGAAIAVLLPAVGSIAEDMAATVKMACQRGADCK